MSEPPLDLEPIEARLSGLHPQVAQDRRALLAEVKRLRAWEAGVRALFAGGPDTPCATTWRRHPGDWSFSPEATECVEVPMEDLRAALSPPPEDTP